LLDRARRLIAAFEAPAADGPAPARSERLHVAAFRRTLLLGETQGIAS